MKGWSPLKYSHRKPFYIPDRARIEPQKIFVMGNLDKYMTIVEKPELHITLQVQSLKIFLQFLDRRPPKRWVLLVIPLREFPNQRPMERLCDLINMRRFEIYCRRALMWSSAMLFLRGARIINFGILPTKYDIKSDFLPSYYSVVLSEWSLLSWKGSLWRNPIWTRGWDFWQS